MNSKSIVASLAAAAVFTAPTIALFLVNQESSIEANDSWQRGIFIFPIALLFVFFLSPAAAKFLIKKGCSSMLRFALGASVLSGSLALVASIPAIAVGIYSKLFSVQAAALATLTFLGLLCASAALSAIAWWLIATQPPNPSFNGTPGGAR
jgi:hypothetical protein